jgi:3-deoxy-D-manno-octulosonic-acid transferase
MHNFTDMTARAKEAYALVQVNNAKEVVDEAISLLSDSEKLKKSQEAAYAWTVQEATVLDKLADVIKEELAR